MRKVFHLLLPTAQSQKVAAPDSFLTPPFTLAASDVLLSQKDILFQNISVDIDVEKDLPDSCYYYISVFNSDLNKIPFYCGIQTQIHTGSSYVGRGAIFSRWEERNRGAARTDGYIVSSDDEGNFVSVRDKFVWHKGRYRILLYRSGYVKGKALPAQYSANDIAFSWKEYEHSWVTMEVQDLDNHTSKEIGALAFPGKDLWLDRYSVLFLEQYGTGVTFAKKIPDVGYPVITYHDLPEVTFTAKNFRLNGKSHNTSKNGCQR